MKKLFCVLLALLMLSGTALLFVSCSGEVDGIVTLSGEMLDVDLSGYELVYGDSQRGEAYTATFRDYMNKFATSLGDATGKKFSAYTMTRAQTGAADKEILVGLTIREESRLALAEIEGDGFIIRVTDNKVVLVGTSNLFTMMAVNYFIERFLQRDAQSAVIPIDKEAIANEVGTLTLASPEGAEYTYVYQDGMGTHPPAFAGTTSAHANSTYEEYSQVAVAQFVEQMKKLSGLRDKSFPVKTDKETYAKEVLVGPVANAESKKVLATAKENECIIAVEGEDVIVHAWNQKGMEVAATRYVDLLTEGTVKAEDGSVSVLFPKNFRFTDTVDVEWVLDFPRPDGLTLYNTMDDNDKALQFLYLGQEINAQTHKSYCDKLLSAGYTVYMDNEIEGSLFTTLVNKEENVMLHVAYNAYGHVGEYQDKYDWTASKVKTKDPHVYEYEPALRVVSAPLDNAYLPEEKLLTKQPYTKRTDSMVSTMPIYNKAVGLAYVVTLEDGSFIVFDGGNVNENGNEYDRLWFVMEELHKKIYGEAPTVSNPIHIAAWVLTHAHGDHYHVFDRMTRKYGSTGLMKMDYMIANIPADTSVYPIRDTGTAVSPAKVAALQKQVKGGFEYIKVHTGYKFHLANIEIEVLTTWEDLNPWVINDSNETNSVLRFTLSNQDDPTAVVTQLWTGDAQRCLSRFLCANYGSYLQSDMMSVGHHGNVGCEIDLYDTVQPTAIWWPHNVSAASNYLNPKNKDKGWQFEVDQYFANEIDSVHYIYTSGERAVGDAYFTTLVITADGPDYENIFDLMTGEKISYSDISEDVYANVTSCMKK